MIILVFNRMGKIFLICSPQINIIYSTIALIISQKKHPPYEILSISSNTVKTSLTFLINYHRSKTFALLNTQEGI